MPVQADQLELIRALQVDAQVRIDGLRTITVEQHDDMESTAGVRIATWHRESRLGAGGFGTVFLETCTEGLLQGQVRAVKVIKKPSDSMRASSGVFDWAKELHALALFSMPKYKQLFVTATGWFEDTDSVLITMDYHSKGDLGQYIVGALPEAECSRIISQVLRGVRAMHSHSIAHRDLKPQNLLVVNAGPRWWVKIADFGISKRVIEQNTSLRSRAGTPAFMAPEVLGLIDEDDTEDVDGWPKSYTHAVDIWATGAICLLLLVGELMFSEPRKLGSYARGKIGLPSAKFIENRTSEEGIYFIESLLSVDPAERPQAATALEHAWFSQYEARSARLTAPSQNAPASHNVASLSWRSTSTNVEAVAPLTIQSRAFGTEFTRPTSPNLSGKARSYGGLNFWEAGNEEEISHDEHGDWPFEQDFELFRQEVNPSDPWPCIYKEEDWLSKARTKFQWKLLREFRDGPAPSFNEDKYPWLAEVEWATPTSSSGFWMNSKCVVSKRAGVGYLTIWDRHSHTSPRKLPIAAFENLAISPDGARIAYKSLGHNSGITLTVVETSRGRILNTVQCENTLGENKSPGDGVNFSSNGKFIVLTRGSSLGYSRSVQWTQFEIRDATSLKLVVLDTQADSKSNMAISAEGRLRACATRSAILLSSLNSKNVTKELDVQLSDLSDGKRYLTFSPDGRLLALYSAIACRSSSCDDDCYGSYHHYDGTHGHIKLWNMQTLTQKPDIEISPSSYGARLVFSPNGRFMALWSSGHASSRKSAHLILHELGGRSQSWIISEGGVCGLDFLPDGRLLLLLGEPGDEKPLRAYGTEPESAMEAQRLEDERLTKEALAKRKPEEEKGQEEQREREKLAKLQREKGEREALERQRLYAESLERERLERETERAESNRTYYAQIEKNKLEDVRQMEECREREKNRGLFRRLGAKFRDE